VDLRASLNLVAKRKIPNPCRELNPDFPASSIVAMWNSEFYFLLRTIQDMKQYHGTSLSPLRLF